MLCECLKCGGLSEIQLTRIISGQSAMCQKCAEKNLKIGHDIRDMASSGGTLVTAIDGRRQTNKNSSTGHTGVSVYKQSGKYRAYINFKRKQYHLGLYDRLEDAISARETAEKEIYGDFLKWYVETYPEKWKQLQRMRGKD